jgi:hypothetical protein
MRYFILLFTVMLSVGLCAQHCPYDGATMIAVKLLDEKGQMLNTSKDTIYLMEIDNPEAGSCSYAEGLLKKPLLTTTEFFIKGNEKYGPNFGETLKKRLKAMGVIDKVNLLVGLNQAERDCMIKKDKDFEYRRRKFVIIYNAGNKKISIPVPPEAIRSLCMDSKDFIDFKPLVIKL